MAYHVKCAERNIFNSVFSVHHGGNGHCGVDTAEQTFADVANGYRNGIEGSSLSCNNARARFSYILLNLAEVKLGGVDSRSGYKLFALFNRNIRDVCNRPRNERRIAVLAENIGVNIALIYVVIFGKS